MNLNELLCNAKMASLLSIDKDDYLYHALRRHDGALRYLKTFKIEL